MYSRELSFIQQKNYNSYYKCSVIFLMKWMFVCVFGQARQGYSTAQTTCEVSFYREICLFQMISAMFSLVDYDYWLIGYTTFKSNILMIFSS